MVLGVFCARFPPREASQVTRRTRAPINRGVPTQLRHVAEGRGSPITPVLQGVLVHLHFTRDFLVLTATD